MQRLPAFINIDVNENTAINGLTNQVWRQSHFHASATVEERYRRHSV